MTTLLSAATWGFAWSTEPVKQKIDLIADLKAGKVEYNLNPKGDPHPDMQDAPKEIFQIGEDSVLRVSGRGWGYAVTNDSYRDYHLVFEYKWGEKTQGQRLERARNNGLFVHCYGPHSAFLNTWMAGIEAQVIEGGTGDLLVISSKDAEGKEAVTSVASEYALDRDGEKFWKPGSPKQTVTKGRINWSGRSEDWKDVKGFRGPKDLESPVGEWNRFEVIAKADKLEYFLNGVKVNEAGDCKPAEGRILLQTEGAEIFIRRYELHPLGKFIEKWGAIQASGNNLPVLKR